ncbi:pseudouridine synthase [Polyangium sorediatum]|uniref:Pseudouridine synthase n=1 Tax=Polyangium sorediatum TaxID=889274 RepID=A0ABT6P1M8_9BACT|nr:pseudouridine synthase [Polyangium sorediatum]MDI1434165.1 pseudouridine synthase [Polyangium sorediatum]
MEERLQKIIARSGVSSRRAAEELVTAGRVRVNGRIVTELGAKADPRRDKIEVDGKRLTAESPVYLVLHKPRNVVSTLHDPEGRPTVADLVRGAGARVYPVGRLDFATSGVLLLTNDGEFSNGMLHPRGGVPKTYVLKVRGVMDEGDADVWRTGVELEDGKTLPADVRILRHEGDKTWLEITLREGRNQQIRRMGEATGFPVMRLARLSFAGVTSEGLLPGKWRLLTVDELLAIRKEFGVPKRVRPAVDQMPAQRAKQQRPRAHVGAAPRDRGERGERGERPRAGHTTREGGREERHARPADRRERGTSGPPRERGTSRPPRERGTSGPPRERGTSGPRARKRPT